MIQNKIPFYLASKSPRRKKLLKQLNINFKTLSFEIDEKLIEGESAKKTVMRLSREKLEKALTKIKHGIILTADTIVVMNNEIIGKPSNKKEAEKFLKKLSGKTHLVYTGFSIYNSVTNKIIVDYEITRVTFRKLTISEIRDYVLTNSPMDKAGAYGIQDDFGAVFVKKINGDYYNVVGLPLFKVYQALLKVL